METGLIHLHNFLRWVILLLLIITIIKNWIDTQKPFNNTHRKLTLFTMIVAHITLLLGLYQVLFGRYSWTTLPTGTNAMKDTFYRFFLVEHPIMMIAAIILITVANSTGKKALPDAKKHKKVTILLLIALLIILAAIPWPFRDVVGRAWFPGA